MSRRVGDSASTGSHWPTQTRSWFEVHGVAGSGSGSCRYGSARARFPTLFPRRLLPADPVAWGGWRGWGAARAVATVALTVAAFDRIVVIFNPQSTGDAPQLAEQLHADLSRRLPEVPVRLCPTQRAGHARDLSPRAEPHALSPTTGAGPRGPVHHAGAVDGLDTAAGVLSSRAVEGAHPCHHGHRP